MAEFNDPGILLQAKTPDFDVATPLINAQRYQVGQQTVEQAGLKTAADTREGQAQSTVLQNQIISDAARKALADPQNGDAYFQAAAKNGAPAATQFVGRLNPFLLNRISEAYGAEAPNADIQTGAGTNPGSPLAAAATGQKPETNNVPNDPIAMMDRQYANASPTQMADSLQHLNQAQNALIAVMRAQDPAKEWETQRQALIQAGIPGADSPQFSAYSPLRVQQLYAAVSPRQSYLQQRVTEQQMGGPKPLIPRNLIKTDAGVIEADPYAAPGTPGKMIAATPSWDRTNTTDAQGQPILADKFSGRTISGSPDDQGTAPTGQPVTAWAAQLDHSENATGDRAAQNPRSSATGNGQFTDSTWLQTAKAALPDVVDGMSDQQILNLRKDPAFSQEMTVANAKTNGAALAKDNQPVNGTTLALAHHFGAEGATKILDAKPDEKLEDLLPASVIKANPELKGQTAGQYAGSVAQQFGVAPVDVGNGVPSTPRTLSPEEKELQTKILPGQFEKAQESYESAQNLKLQLGNMQDQLGQLGTTGFLAPGTGDTARLAFAKKANSFATAAGIDPKDLPFDQNKVASGEDIVKGTTRLGFDLARQLGSREAMMIVQQAVGAVPGLENTPRGAKLIFGALNTAAQRQSDYYEFLQKWASTHPSTLGADVAFNKANPVQHYTNQALLAAVPPGRIDYLKANPKLAPQFDTQYGKGLSAVILGDK